MDKDSFDQRLKKLAAGVSYGKAFGSAEALELISILRDSLKPSAPPEDTTEVQESMPTRVPTAPGSVESPNDANTE